MELVKITENLSEILKQLTLLQEYISFKLDPNWALDFKAYCNNRSGINPFLDDEDVEQKFDLDTSNFIEECEIVPMAVTVDIIDRPVEKQSRKDKSPKDSSEHFEADIVKTPEPNTSQFIDGCSNIDLLCHEELIEDEANDIDVNDDDFELDIDMLKNLKTEDADQDNSDSDDFVEQAVPYGTGVHPSPATKGTGLIPESSNVDRLKGPIATTYSSSKKPHTTKEQFDRNIRKLYRIPKHNNKDGLLYFPTAQYNLVLEQLQKQKHPEIQSASGKYDLDCMKMFEVGKCRKTGVPILLKKGTQLRIAKAEQLFNIIMCAHLATGRGHIGRDLLLKHLGKVYCNIVRKEIVMFLSMVNCCKDKRINHAKKDTLEANDHEVII